MVWDQQSLVIVMTTKTMERGRVKCHQYWEPAVDDSCVYGDFTVKTTSVDSNEDYTVASLEIKNSKVRRKRWRRDGCLTMLCILRLMKPETYHIGSSRAGPITAFRLRRWQCWLSCSVFVRNRQRWWPHLVTHGLDIRVVLQSSSIAAQELEGQVRILSCIRESKNNLLYFQEHLLPLISAYRAWRTSEQLIFVELWRRFELNELIPFRCPTNMCFVI